MKALDPAERPRQARAKTEKLVSHVQSLLLMHEANAIVLYSPALRSQIPASHAGHAFNQFQSSMHLFELLRLTALWDGYGTHRESIPTILALMDDPAVEAIVVEEMRRHFAELGVHDLTPTDDPDIQALKDEWLQDHRASMSATEAAKTAEKFRFALTKGREVKESASLKALVHLRDHRMAHNLEMDQEQIAALPKEERLHYGDERTLLEHTIEVADALHQSLNGTGFMWDDARKISRRNAKALWEACTFKVVD